MITKIVKNLHNPINHRDSFKPTYFWRPDVSKRQTSFLVTKLVYRELPTATQNYANRRKTDAYSCLLYTSNPAISLFLPDTQSSMAVSKNAKCSFVKIFSV